MRRLMFVTATLGVAGVTLAVIAPLAPGHYPLGGGKTCKALVVPNTDYRAIDIKRRDVGCKKVHGVIRRAVSGEAIDSWDCIRRARRSGDPKTHQAHIDAKCRKGSSDKVFILAIVRVR